MSRIGFNIPHFTGKETGYILDALASGKISGNGIFTEKAQILFNELFHFNKSLITSSCTDALEMSSILLDIMPGDEVIMPSFTFVSTANAFILRGAEVKFVDSRPDHPGMDEDLIEPLITEKTKAIVPVHYAGVACDMGKIADLAVKYGLKICEDAAQAVDSYYMGQSLGSFGDTAAFSFHETKNISSGEGGMLVVNNKELQERAEIIWEKGTNRSAFFRGEVDKYNWVDIGSSFLPSDIIAALLFAQLEDLRDIQENRMKTWNRYYEILRPLAEGGHFRLPSIPDYATNNAHMFYLVCNSLDARSSLIDSLKRDDISAVFHYISLHRSPYFKSRHDNRNLPWSDLYSNNLVRLPLFYGLTETQMERITQNIKEWCRSQKGTLS